MEHPLASELVTQWFVSNFPGTTSTALLVDSLAPRRGDCALGKRSTCCVAHLGAENMREGEELRLSHIEGSTVDPVPFPTGRDAGTDSAVVGTRTARVELLGNLILPTIIDVTTSMDVLPD